MNVLSLRLIVIFLLLVTVSGVDVSEEEDDLVVLEADADTSIRNAATVADSASIDASNDDDDDDEEDLAGQLLNNDHPHELFDAHSSAQLGYWWVDQESRCETHARTEFVALDDTWEQYRPKKGAVVRTLKRTGYNVTFKHADELVKTLAAAPSLPPLVQLSFPADNLRKYTKRLEAASDPYVEDACGGRLKARVNHLCSGCNKLTLKAPLHTCYNENKARREGLGEFLLETFVIPDELDEFVDSAWRDGESDDVRWILKPYHGGLGIGHRIMDRVELRAYAEMLAERVANGEKLSLTDNDLGRIAQRVLDNPLVLARRKFDIRVMATITSMDPLFVWIPPKGLTYAPRKPYESDSKERSVLIGNNFDGVYLDFVEKAHKFDDGALHSDQRFPWPLSEFLSTLTYHGYDPAPLWSKIKDAIVGSVLITNAGVADYFDAHPRLWEHTYEHFGWDVTIRDTLEPVAFEANYEPDVKEQWGRVVTDFILAYLHDETRLVAPNPPIFRFGDPYYRSLAPESFLDEYDALRVWVSKTIGSDALIPWCTSDEKTRRNKAILDDPLRKKQRPASEVESDKYTPRGYFVDLDAFPASTFLDCVTYDDIEVIVDAEEHLLRRSSFELASFPFSEPFRFARLYPTRRNILLARWFELSRTNRTGPIEPYYHRGAVFNSRDEYELLEVKDHRLFLDGDDDDDTEDHLDDDN